MFLRLWLNWLLLSTLHGFPALNNYWIRGHSKIQKALKHFASFLDVVTPRARCQGSSARESARLKTESSQVQTLPSAPHYCLENVCFCAFFAARCYACIISSIFLFQKHKTSTNSLGNIRVNALYWSQIFCCALAFWLLRSNLLGVYGCIVENP